MLVHMMELKMQLVRSRSEKKLDELNLKQRLERMISIVFE